MYSRLFVKSGMFRAGSSAFAASEAGPHPIINVDGQRETAFRVTLRRSLLLPMLFTQESVRTTSRHGNFVAVDQRRTKSAFIRSGRNIRRTIVMRRSVQRRQIVQLVLRSFIGPRIDGPREPQNGTTPGQVIYGRRK